MNQPSPVAPPTAGRSSNRPSVSLGREGRITALTLLKSYYDEEIFQAARAADLRRRPRGERSRHTGLGLPGNEVAVPHLYQIIERGKKSQRLAAIEALAAIRAPTSVGMLVKYFNHFSGEDDVRTAILGALNTIAPSHAQVQELDQAVLVDAHQGEEARRIAIEALVEAGKSAQLARHPATDPALGAGGGLRADAQARPGTARTSPATSWRPAPSVPTCAFIRSRRTAATRPRRAPSGLARACPTSRTGCSSACSGGSAETVRSFLVGLTNFPGRLRFPSRVALELLLAIPFVDVETRCSPETS